MRHLHRHRTRCAHIMEYDYRSDDAAQAVVNWCRGILNWEFESVTTNEHAIYCEPHRFVLHDGHFHRISRDLTSGTVDNMKDFRERSCSGFGARPTGQGFGNSVKICDIS